jgi:hypothetical protein
MPDPEQPRAEFTATDLQAFRDSWREFTEIRRLWLDKSFSILETSFSANENAASFYEKLILLDGGTIALSLTLLGGIIARGSHVPRYPFMWLVCPAWVLLLTSINLCSQHIVAFHNLNKDAVEQVRVLTDNQYLSYLAVILNRMSLQVPGEVTDTSSPTVFLSKTSKDMMRAAEDQGIQLKELAQKVGTANKTKLKAQIAFVATWVAFLLLCTFAIVAFLSI